MRLRPPIGIIAFLCVVFLTRPAVEAQTPNSAVAPVKSAPSGTPFRVLRSVSGAAGHEDNGRFIMDDPRSVFTAGKDAKVIVYFEWEGPLGPHHFEGLWKSPEGKIVLISDFRYEARGPHFSGYWTMLLPDTTASGEWAVEARIDGEAAGFHSFVVTGSPAAAAAAAKPARPMLTTPELYRAATESSVTMESVAADGTLLRKSSGFWISDSLVLTSFEAIDGATSLRVHLGDGSRVTTDHATAWNRWQDWAILSLAGKGKTFLKRGPKTPLNVGDHCVFLEWGPAGAQLTDGTISGKSTFPHAGERLLVASGATAQSIGGPLLNDFGEYVGVIGGTIAPGGSPLKMLGLINDTPLRDDVERIESQALAVPVTLIAEPDVSTPTASFAELSRRGEFLEPVENPHIVGAGSFSSAMQEGGEGPVLPRDYKEVFTSRDPQVAVYIRWDSISKQKGSCTIRIYNLDNELLTAEKPLDVTLTPGKYQATAWSMPAKNFSPGIYRVDVIFAGKVVWRDFFRMTE